MASVNEWVELATELRRANAGRQIDCFMLQNAYSGNLWNLTGQPFQQDRSGRVILRDTRRDGQSRSKPLVVNYLKAIVDDYVALLGSVPDVKVPAPGPAPKDQEFADRMERFHYGVWHASSMQLQMKAVAWWDSVMGGSVGIVWPDFKRGHPVFRFTAPYMAFSVPSATEPFMLDKCIIVERHSLKSIRESYPNANIPDTSLGMFEMSSQAAAGNYLSAYGSSAPDGSGDVMKCFDKNEVVTIIGNKQVARARHELDFCPVVHIPNILVPGSIHRYEGDIEQTVGLAQHASFIAQAYEEYVLQDIYSPLVVEGLMEGKVPEDITPLDPNAIIPVNIGGKVYRLPAGQGSTVVGQEMSRTQGIIEYMTGVPQVRMEGTLKSSITTGRGIDRAQGPYFSRTEYRTEILAFFLEQMNSMAVRMQEAIFPHKDFTLFGMRGKRTDAYVLKMNTDELQGYDFNKVIYSMAMGMDPMQRMVFAKQGLEGDKPLFDKRWAIEFLGITDHPDEMLTRIDADQEKVVQAQVRMRTEMAGAQTQTTGAPSTTMAQAANLEGGGTGAPPSVPAAVAEEKPASPFSTRTGIVPIAAPTQYPIDPTTPPTDKADLTSGLDQPLIEQVRRIVGTLGLKGSLWAVDKGDRLQLTAAFLSDAKKVNNALDGIYGKRVTVRTSKTVPPGATDLTQNVTQTAANPPA